MFQSFGGWFCIILFFIAINIYLGVAKKNSLKASFLTLVCLIVVFQAAYYVGYFKYRALCDNNAKVEFVRQTVMPAGIDNELITRAWRAEKYLDMGFSYVRGENNVIYSADNREVTVDRDNELTSWGSKTYLKNNIYEYQFGWKIGEKQVFYRHHYSYSGGWIDDWFSNELSLNYIENCGPENNMDYLLTFKGMHEQ
jgi:hypothetical protein